MLWNMVKINDDELYSTVKHAVDIESPNNSEQSTPPPFIYFLINRTGQPRNAHGQLMHPQLMHPQQHL